MAVISYLAIAMAILLPFLYTYTTTKVQATFPTLRNKRICLLIAHPDDEAMFFSPTVLALTRPELENHVQILCLSTGDADGLGETRKKELVKSGMLLGLKDESDVSVIDDTTKFRDSMTTVWKADDVSDLLAERYAPSLLRPSRAETTKLDVIITFDDKGISAHPNHISLYYGALAFISALTERHDLSPISLYTLKTVGLLQKYGSILDGVLTASLWDKNDKKQLLFMNHLRGNEGAVYSKGFNAMTEAHKSQMRWFRYGWIVLSRYMVINELRLDEIHH